MQQSNNIFKIFFAGDFCSKPSTSLISVSEELKSKIQACDLKVVNFEVPLRPEIELPKRINERFFKMMIPQNFFGHLGSICIQ